MVAIPAAAVPAAIEEAGARGCGGAVVFGAGFAGSRRARRPAAQAELAAAAHRHGLPGVRPKRQRDRLPGRRVALWGDALAPGLQAGDVALVSQSGNVAVNALATRRGLRFHTVVSCGNQAVLDAAGFVDAPRRRGRRALDRALYLEDDGDGARLCEALARCAEAGVGVAVLKVASRRRAPWPRPRTPARWPATSACSGRWSRRPAPPGRRTPRAARAGQGAGGQGTRAARAAWRC